MLKLWWPRRPGWDASGSDEAFWNPEGENGVALRLVDLFQGAAAFSDAPLSPDVEAAAPVSGRLVLGDNLDLLTCLEREGSTALDLVYIDPPFGTGKRRQGPKGRYDDATADEEIVSRIWFLLNGLSRLLSNKGQVMVHVDWRASAWVRLLLDEVFGPEAFRNEIVWHYSSGGRAGKQRYARKWDAILWYAPGKNAVFRPERIARPRNVCPHCGREILQRNHMKRHRDEQGRVYRTIRSQGRVYRYYDDELVAPPDVWQDISHIQQRSPERTGYPTQKPEALLERILLAHSDPGDRVADFFCGSGTTLAVAHRLGRHWIGCDQGKEAIELTRERLTKIVEQRGGSLRLEEVVSRPGRE